MLFELDGVTEQQARIAMRLAATKLPIRVRFVTRHGNTQVKVSE
jgi:ribosomal protein L16/L10AE